MSRKRMVASAGSPPPWVEAGWGICGISASAGLAAMAAVAAAETAASGAVNGLAPALDPWAPARAVTPLTAPAPTARGARRALARAAAAGMIFFFSLPAPRPPPL